MRRASQSWVGRGVMAIVMAVIIVSFAIWGIGDIFRGIGSNNVAEVGGTSVTADELRTAYQSQLQQLQQQAGRAITADEARAAGLDQQVLARLVTDAVIGNFAKSIGLAISDADVAKLVQTDPTFQGPDGRFNAANLQAVLRDQGLTERFFIRDQRDTYLRRDIAEAFSGDMPVPRVALEAFNHFRNEVRSLDAVTLTPAAAGEIPTPAPDVLQKFFDDRRQAFRAPEYRKVVFLAVTPSSEADAAAVSDADAAALYDTRKSTTYTTVERRTLDEIVFPDEAAAIEASQKLKAGTSFPDVAKAAGQSVVALGELTKADIADPALGDAAFTTANGAVSAPVKTQFGFAMVRVAAVAPATTRPLADVQADLKAEIAKTRSQAQVNKRHDTIEDSRTAGKPLADAAKDAGLTVTTIGDVDANGRDKSGAAVPNLPEQDALLKAAFASDVGLDTEPLTTADGGYVWYEVAAIEPAHDRTLDDVRAKVEAAWRDDEISRRLAAKASDLVKALNDGATVETVAAQNGNLPLQHIGDAKRVNGPDYPAALITQVFTTPVDKAGSASDGANRIVFKVLGSVVPPLDEASDTTQGIARQLGQALTGDVIGQYLARLQSAAGVRVNQNAAALAIGSNGAGP